jgi:hypothetical protein
VNQDIDALQYWKDDSVETSPLGRAFRKLSSKVGQWWHSGKETIHEGKEKAEETAKSAYDKLQNAKDYIGAAKDKAKEITYRGSSDFGQAFNVFEKSLSEALNTLKGSWNCDCEQKKSARL